MIKVNLKQTDLEILKSCISQESPEEVSIGLPFLADLGLGLSVLSCTMLHLLYQGQEKTKEEESCQHLLKSKLLQR